MAFVAGTFPVVNVYVDFVRDIECKIVNSSCQLLPVVELFPVEMPPYKKGQVAHPAVYPDIKWRIIRPDVY